MKSKTLILLILLTVPTLASANFRSMAVVELP